MSKNEPKTAEQETIAAEQETALAVSPQIDETGITAMLTSRKQIFCSVSGESAAEKAVMFKAMNNPDFRISEKINAVIEIKDIFAEMIEIVHKETGEIEVAPRVVMIDSAGRGYQAVSSGIFGALKKLIAVFGPPTWETPIKIKILQIERKGKRILTFDVV